MKFSINNRLTQSITLGVAITIASAIIVGFNVKTNGDIPVNDTINRYFDTCLREALTSSTPRIKTDDRGFPLAYYSVNNVPVCESGVAVKTYEDKHFKAFSVLLNIFFWTTIAFLAVGRLRQSSTEVAPSVAPSTVAED